MLKPLQLSLETKSDRLKSRALAITQNLIANHALPGEASDAVSAAAGAGAGAAATACRSHVHVAVALRRQRAQQ